MIGITRKHWQVSLSRRSGFSLFVGPFGLFIMRTKFYGQPVVGHSVSQWCSSLWFDWLGVYASVDRFPR